MANNTKSSKMMKVVYFDETAATDYITIQNGGQIDWTSTENKERLAKMIAEIDMQAKGGFNLFSFIKASVSGNANTNIDTNTSKLIKKQTLEFFGIDKDEENNQKRLRDLENGQCLLQDLYGRVGVVQIHPVFEELLHAFDTRPPVQRNEVE